MSEEKLRECPCCKSKDIKEITLHCEFGFEWYCECWDCGVVFKGK